MSRLRGGRVRVKGGKGDRTRKGWGEVIRSDNLDWGLYNKKFSVWESSWTNVPFVNRPFESEIHGTVNFTQFCCVLLVTWCYCVLLSCYLRPK